MSARGPRRARAVVLLALGACDRPVAPSPAGHPAASAPAASFQPLAPPPASVGPRASESASGPRRPAVGGAWVGCIAGFRRSGAAGVDAGRLGEACGGKLGMAPAGAWQGELREGDEWTGELTLRPGDCVRLLAVGGSGVTALSLALLDERGRVVAGDGSDDGWPLVPPDGTTCVVAGGPYAVRARSVRGAGPFAAQAWRLP